MKLAVVRHGQGVHNVKSYYNSDPNGPKAHLTELGKKQAEQAGNILQNHDMDVVDGTYVSQLVRTQETLQHMIIEAKWIKKDPLLNESLAGRAEGKTYEEMRLKYGVEDSWDWEAAHHYWGAESTSSILSRVRQFLNQLPWNSHGKYVVVTHGAIMSLIISELTGKLDYRPTNAEVMLYEHTEHRSPQVSFHTPKDCTED